MSNNKIKRQATGEGEGAYLKERVEFIYSEQINLFSWPIMWRQLFVPLHNIE